MDRNRRLYWGKYARDLADKMELRDWTINTIEPFAPDGANASVDCAYGRKIATIRFCPGFDQRDPEGQRTSVVHELIHCHLAAADQALHIAADNVDKSWIRHVESTVSLHHEYGVAALADVIAPFMPLPPRPKKKQAKASKKAAP